MPKFLVEASYSPEGVQGLIKDGASKRVKTATGLVESLGGTVENFYYAFGSTDIYGVVDMPDNVSATAVSLAVNASGAVGVSLTPLLTAAEVDAACTKVPSFQAPGS